MGFLKFIGFVVAFIIIRFIIDLIIQSKKMKAQGGVRQKYSKFIDDILASHPDSKIFHEDNTSVVVGVHGIAGSQVFYITKAFEVVIIQIKVKNNPLFGNIEREWKFPENMDQDKIITQIKNDMKKDMEMIIKNIGHHHAEELSLNKDDIIAPISKQNIGVDDISQDWWKAMEEKCGITKEGVKETLEKLNLAPDLSKNNELENKLFNIAKQGVSMIESSFKVLPEGGYAEALIYCSSILVDLGTEHKNSIDLDIFEDRYFLLLHDEVLRHSNVDNVIEYINNRVEFYNEQEIKLRSSSYFTPMFIYNTFYMNPGCDSPSYLKNFNESPAVLMTMQTVLNQTRFMMEKKAIEIGYQLPSLDDLI